MRRRVRRPVSAKRHRYAAQVSGGEGRPNENLFCREGRVGRYSRQGSRRGVELVLTQVGAGQKNANQRQSAPNRIGMGSRWRSTERGGMARQRTPGGTRPSRTVVEGGAVYVSLAAGARISAR